jgi:hypothetical protein
LITGANSPTIHLTVTELQGEFSPVNRQYRFQVLPKQAFSGSELQLGRYPKAATSIQYPAASTANAGAFLQTSLSEVTRRRKFRRSPALTRRVTHAPGHAL